MPRRRKSPHKKRRGRGEGALFFSERLQLWIGRVRQDGRTVERQAATKDGVLKKLAKIQPPGENTTVREWSGRWLDALHVRPSTRDSYEFFLNRFTLPALGNLPVRKVTSHGIQEAATRWSGEVGPNTVRTVMGQLGGMLEAARRAGLITTNPAKDARKPKGKRRVINPFTVEELTRIIAGANLPHLYPFALLASTGCRLGESLAADVTDVDPVAGTISITKTYTRKHGTRPPKSENGIRTIRIPAAALPHVIAAVGNRTTGALFPTFPSYREGRRQHTSVQGGWQRYLKSLGLPHRNLHQLRHSVATALISSGAPIGDVAKYLGDTAQTVVATYLHAAGTDPAAALDKLFSGDRQSGDKVGESRTASAKRRKTA